MLECFDLMDADGSGAIDAGEMGAAFKLLGFRLSRAEVEGILAEVDHDGSGEEGAGLGGVLWAWWGTHDVTCNACVARPAASAGTASLPQLSRRPAASTLFITRAAPLSPRLKARSSTPSS